MQLTLTLLETCVKNCGIHFHRYINNRNLLTSLLLLLRRKRKKLNFVDKIAGVYKSADWREIETKVLGLVQLWADTFMMHEDKYPCFMRAYRELRKEGIQFPTRDPNERFMIKFEGDPSPAFELAEMEYQLNPGNPPREFEPSRAVVHNEEAEEVPVLTPEDIANLRVSIPRLEEIIMNVTEFKQFQEPEVKELVRKSRLAQRKLIWFVSYHTTHVADEAETFELLEIMDFVNAKMDSFKNAARLVKRDAAKDEVRQALAIREDRAASDLLDEDFLEVPTESPLEKLEKFANKQPVNEPPAREEEKIQEKPRLQEPPDLLFQEEEPPVDLLSHELDPPQNPPQPPADMFDLSSLIFGEQTAPQPPTVDLPQALSNPFSVQDPYDDFFSDLAHRRNN